MYPSDIVRKRKRIGAPLSAVACVLAGVAVAMALGHVPGLEAVPLAPVLLYNRLNRNATFDNDTRRKVFDYVKRMPGACIADIALGVGVSHSTASYHLDKLCGFSLLTSTVDGNKVRFFINGGAFTEDERRTLSVLDNGETRRVLAAIARNPWCYRAELTTILGVSSPTVNWHLERLNSCKVVEENRSGRNRFLFVDKRRLEQILTTVVAKLRDTGYDYSGLEDLIMVSREPAIVREP